jgi:hypothetical protein
MKGYVAILTLRGILTFNCDSIAASPPVRAYFERTRISKISFGTPVYFYPSILHQVYVARATNRKGKREYLNDSLTHSLIKGLNEYFQTKVEIPRIRMGKKQEIETLINEEAFLLAMYLRNEKLTWIPRIADLS